LRIFKHSGGPFFKQGKTMTNPVIFARMPQQDVELIRKVSRARGEDLSDFVRRAVYKELADLNFLPDDQKQALGIKRANPYISHQKPEEPNKK